MSAVSSSCETLGCLLTAVFRLAAGVACVLSGLVLIVTFWLMFVGIPLALFGVALIASDRA